MDLLGWKTQPLCEAIFLTARLAAPEVAARSTTSGAASLVREDARSQKSDCESNRFKVADQQT